MRRHARAHTWAALCSRCYVRCRTSQRPRLAKVAQHRSRTAERAPRQSGWILTRARLARLAAPGRAAQRRGLSDHWASWPCRCRKPPVQLPGGRQEQTADTARSNDAFCRARSSTCSRAERNNLGRQRQRSAAIPEFRAPVELSASAAGTRAAGRKPALALDNSGQPLGPGRRWPRKGSNSSLARPVAQTVAVIATVHHGCCPAT